MGQRLIHNELEKQAYWRPNHLAMAFEEYEYTYCEFNKRVNRVAHALADRGIGEKDRLVAHGKDHVDWHTIFYACSKLGATFCPVSKFQSLENLRYIIDTLNPSFVFYTNDPDIVKDRLSAIRDTAPEATYTTIDQSGIGGDTTLESLIEGYSSENPEWKDEHAPDTTHNVFWTSGTTGRPKAVKRNHRSSLHFSDNLINDLPFREWNRRITTNSMMLIDAYFHYGIPTVMTGGTNIMIREFSPEHLYEKYQEYEVNSLHLGFTIARLVLEYLEKIEADLDLRYLSAVIPTSNFANELWEHTDKLYHLYGTTEIGLPLVKRITPPFDERPSLGKPGVGAEVRLVQNETDRIPDTPPDIWDEGELACRGETTMTSYLSQDHQQENMEDGWILPGDAIRINQNRDIVFLGRTDDQIRSGGINVYPGDIENVLEDHPSVSNAIVVGVEDDTWGERICSLIITESDQDNSELSEALDKHCRESGKITNELRPREYAFVQTNDQIPSGSLGKPDRPAIVNQFFG